MLWKLNGHLESFAQPLLASISRDNAKSDISDQYPANDLATMIEHPKRHHQKSKLLDTKVRSGADSSLSQLIQSGSQR